MSRIFRVNLVVAAFGLGLLVAPPVSSAAPGTSASSALACVANPDSGWVLFYEHSGCQGHYQGWTTCEPHNFTGAMKNAASSYWDNQTGGATADVTDSNGHFVFRTIITQRRVYDVSSEENDRSFKAWLNC
ncbi:hypothetical protein [Lentzea sp. NPDC059081]|uniref:hypothetical protein n=1 Tax=Lentzea sp. NPDC059081 TaxID=3346719 RepID=UPI003673D991